MFFPSFLIWTKKTLALRVLYVFSCAFLVSFLSFLFLFYFFPYRFNKKLLVVTVLRQEGSRNKSTFHRNNDLLPVGRSPVDDNYD